MASTPALVVLADGNFFTGTAFGARGRTFGEVVFNTSMTGYQEILTDPSYSGQLVTMTSPHIGNYGVNELDVESTKVQAAGLIVREASRSASNYRATGTLQDYLTEQGVSAISGVDTRALTRRIRDAGAIMGAIVHDAVPADVPEIVAAIQAQPDYGSRDFVSAASVKVPSRVVLEPTGDAYCPTRVQLVADMQWPAEDAAKPLVVVVDYGVKFSILRRLADEGVRVLLVPHDMSSADVLGLAPEGILLSNGPGDPGAMDGAVERVKALIGHGPLFGICLGHQLLSRALGGETFKLPFGHRGPNQPVMEAATGKVQITSQNHGYAVKFATPPEDLVVTYKNLNDGTVEGIEIPSIQAFSVQHHPEAGPGPRDALPMFRQFGDAIRAKSA